MDIVELKFRAFKAFLKPHITDTAHQMALSSAPLEVFLQSLAQYKDMDPVDITKKISAAFNVNLSEYDTRDIEKLYRNLSYFIEVTKAFGY